MPETSTATPVGDATDWGAGGTQEEASQIRLRKDIRWIHCKPGSFSLFLS